MTHPGNVPPKHLPSPYDAPHVGERATALETISSDELAAYVTAQHHGGKNGPEECRNIQMNHAVARKYNVAKGCAYPAIEDLVSDTGLSRRTVIRALERILDNWHRKSGQNHMNSEYRPKGNIAALLRDFRDGKGKETYPTKLDPRRGFEPDTRTPRKRQEFEPVDDSGDTDSWCVPGTMEVLAEMGHLFMDPSLSPAEKLALTGIRHSNQVAFLAGELAYPSEEASGFSSLSGHMLHISTGWVSVDASYFTGTRRWNAKFVQRMRQELVASGLWREDRDRATRQSVLTPTALFLSQMTAWVRLRAQKNPQTGKPMGGRVNITTKQPSIGGIVAARAVELGINDQVGVPGMTLDNATVAPAGTVFSVDADGKPAVEGPAIHRKSSATSVADRRAADADQARRTDAGRSTATGTGKRKSTPRPVDYFGTPISDPSITRASASADENPYVQTI